MSTKKQLTEARRKGQAKGVANRNAKGMDKYSTDYRVKLSKWLLERFNNKIFNYHSFYPIVGVSRDTFKSRLIAGKLKDSDIDNILSFLQTPSI